MIIETINIKEYHANGTLWIDEVRCYVHEASIGFYNGVIKSFTDGRYFFRKSVYKYFDNGQLGWSLLCDNNGNIINKNEIRYRKSGEVIT